LFKLLIILDNKFETKIPLSVKQISHYPEFVLQCDKEGEAQLLLSVQGATHPNP